MRKALSIMLTVIMILSLINPLYTVNATDEVNVEVTSTKEVSTETIATEEQQSESKEEQKQETESVTTENVTTELSTEQQVVTDEVSTDTEESVTTECTTELVTEEISTEEQTTVEATENITTEVESEEATTEESTVDTNEDEDGVVGPGVENNTDKLVTETNENVGENNKSEYNITTQEEWDNLWIGVTDTNFANYTYNGVGNLTITLNCNIDITSTPKMQFSDTAGTVTLDLNNNTLSTDSTIISSNTSNKVIVKNGTISNSDSNFTIPYHLNLELNNINVSDLVVITSNCILTNVTGTSLTIPTSNNSSNNKAISCNFTTINANGSTNATLENCIADTLLGNSANNLSIIGGTISTESQLNGNTNIVIDGASLGDADMGGSTFDIKSVKGNSLDIKGSTGIINFDSNTDLTYLYTTSIQDITIDGAKIKYMSITDCDNLSIYNMNTDVEYGPITLTAVDNVIIDNCTIKNSTNADLIKHNGGMQSLTITNSTLSSLGSAIVTPSAKTINISNTDIINIQPDKSSTYIAMNFDNAVADAEINLYKVKVNGYTNGISLNGISNASKLDISNCTFIGTQSTDYYNSAIQIRGGMIDTVQIIDSSFKDFYKSFYTNTHPNNYNSTTRIRNIIISDNDFTGFNIAKNNYYSYCIDLNALYTDNLSVTNNNFNYFKYGVHFYDYNTKVIKQEFSNNKIYNCFAGYALNKGDIINIENNYFEITEDNTTYYNQIGDYNSAYDMCSAIHGYGQDIYGNYTIKNNIIKNYCYGIIFDDNNESSTGIIEDNEFLNVYCGIYSRYYLPIKINNCKFIGNESLKQTEYENTGMCKHSCGIYTGGTDIPVSYIGGYRTVSDNRVDTISNVEISGFDSGIVVGYSGHIYVKDSTITNVTFGISNQECSPSYSSSAWAENCYFEGNNHKDSNGFMPGSSNHSVLLNCTIKNFQTGVYVLNTPFIFGNDITNVNNGIICSDARIYSNNITNVKFGIIGAGNGPVVMNNIINGSSKDTGIGISDIDQLKKSPIQDYYIYYNNMYGNGTIELLDIKQWTYILNSNFGMDYVYGNYDVAGMVALKDLVKNKITQKNTISNFNMGTCLYNSHLWGIDISNCEYGIYNNCSGGNNFYKNNKISNCTYGIFGTNSNDYCHYINIQNNLNPKEKLIPNIEISDCIYGFIIENDSTPFYIGTSNNINPNYNILLKDNKYAMRQCIDQLYRTSIAAIRNENGIDLYTNSGDMQDENNNFYLVNNKNYNMKLEENVKMKIADNLLSSITTKNGGTKNLNIVLDGQLILKPTESFETSRSSYYLLHDDDTEKGYITFESEPKSVSGMLTFDTLDDYYYEGRIVGKTVTEDFAKYLDEHSHLGAKKDGWIVKSSGTDLVFKEGVMVTYDYETNGGTKLSQKYETISIEKGDKIDLTPTAEKEGSDFIGWSLKPNSTEILDTSKEYKALVSDEFMTHVTLYAVFGENIDITYHTYDDVNYTQSTYIYNDTIESTVELLENKEILPNDLKFVGYSLSENNTTKNLLNANDSIKVSKDGLDIYCVYEKSGTIFYQDMFEHIIDTDTTTSRFAGKEKPITFVYKTITYEPENGYQFNGWIDKSDISTTLNIIPGNMTYKTTLQTNSLILNTSPILCTDINVTPKKKTFTVGEDTHLTVDILPDNALNTKVEWYSEDPSIATVDETGLVETHDVGTVKIYAKTKDGSDITDYSTIIIKYHTDDIQEDDIDDPNDDSSNDTSINFDVSTNDTPPEDVTTEDIPTENTTDGSINISETTTEEIPTEEPTTEQINIEETTEDISTEIPTDEPEIRTVTVRGNLKTNLGNAVKNKKVCLESDEYEYWSKTNDSGSFVFNDIRVGTYMFSVYSNDLNTTFATCEVTIAAPDSNDSDSVSIVSQNDDTDVNYKIDGDIFTINLDIEEESEPVTPPSIDNIPATGDIMNIKTIFIIFMTSIILLFGLCIIKTKKK